MNPDCLPVEKKEYIVIEENLSDARLESVFTETQPEIELQENSNLTKETIGGVQQDTEPEEEIIAEVHRGTVDNPFLYNASRCELQKFILTNMFVAGKNASVQQAKLDAFIACVKRDIGEFAVDTMGIISAIFHAYLADEMTEKISSWLKEVKAGQYNRLSAGIKQLALKIGNLKLDLKTCTRENLVGIKGIGYKTASMFLMYTRKNWRGACLDTHILKYMREEANLPNIPINTPALRQDYILIESMFIRLADDAAKNIADFDFEIWSKYRVKPVSNS